MIEQITVIQEKALLVGVVTHKSSQININIYLDELEFLAKTAGAKVLGRITQKISKKNPTTLIGTGKARSLINQAEELGADLIIFDDELTPAQIKNYHKMSNKLKIMDRSGIILDIFQKHAKTKEATTQVDLAYFEYL